MKVQTIDSISKVDWDVIVIGAGVAGAGLALQASQKGRRVLHVEAKAFPRDKVCGGCLNQRAQASLSRLGVLSRIVDIGGVFLDRFNLRIGKVRSDWTIPPLLSVSRRALDSILVQAAVDSGATFLDQTKAAIEHDTSATQKISEFVSVGLTQDLKTVQAHGRVVVVADGLTRSSLRSDEAFGESRIMSTSRIGVQTLLQGEQIDFGPGAQTLSMLVSKSGYVGFSRCEEGKLDVAAAVDPAMIRRCGGPQSAVETIVSRILDRRIAFPRSASWSATPLLTRSSSVVAGRRWFSIGDSTGYIEPFTGEGMAWALADAEGVFRFVDNVIESGWHESIADEWKDWVECKHRRNRRRCRWLSSQLRRPYQAEWMLRFCNAFPIIRNAVIRKVVS